ncbi:GNAT family N-acetyltransferase [Rhabdothermincola sp.]|uniref:GNAT family N-acetyltransferase n=1 Tax=Rhabdothermincola sp. TaxID=2820405 RepID=UPI002FE027C1
MTGRAELRTERLVLRRWRPEDREPFAALNADPEVMRWFPKLLNREESDALVDRIEAAFERDGFGFWAVEVPGGEPFIGFVGLGPVPFEAHFTPAVEIGWRLVRSAWGRGYATEAARRVLDASFHSFDLDEVVSYTVAGNRRSRRVMERLGMTRDPRDDFEHPLVEAGTALTWHVLYRLSRTGFAAGAPGAASPRG